MKVCKFGGSSVADLRGIKNIESLAQNQERRILVFSALGRWVKNDKKTTDLLIEAYENYISMGTLCLKTVEKKFIALKSALDIEYDIKLELEKVKESFNRLLSRDFLISRGEDITASMFAKKLSIRYIPSEQLLFMKNNGIDFEKTRKAIGCALDSLPRFITGGFYGSDENGNIKLLSRGGGDLSGAVFARVTKANEYEIFTDVDGIFQIAPNKTKSYVLKTLSYADLNFMTSLDANVVHKECGRILKNTRTKIIVRNCFDLSCEGTTIAKGLKADKKYISFQDTTNTYFLTKNGRHQKIKKNEEKNMLNLLLN